MKILIAGIYSSFQNLGNFGFQDRGVPIGGAMDQFSLKLLNILLGNLPNEAAIELHFPGPKIAFEESLDICISGADFDAKINAFSIQNNKVYKVNEGDILSFGKKINGERAYLGIRGGFDIPINDLLFNPKLLSDTSISISQKIELPKERLGLRIRNEIVGNHIVEIPIVLNKDFYHLQKSKESQLPNLKFQISHLSNRMGIRLESKNKIFGTDIGEKISFPVSRGSIQLPPDGNPIILMSDSQVTGGYPVLGFIPESALNKISQFPVGKQVYFSEISIEKAIELNNQESLFFEKLKYYVNIGKAYN